MDEEKPDSSKEGPPQEEGLNREKKSQPQVNIATRSGMPKYYTFKVRGVVKGQHIIALIDGGAMHNFIDVALLAKRGLPTKEFDGLDVIVADEYNLDCT